MGISGTVSTVLVLTMLLGLASLCAAVNVTYDSRALVIDGKRRVLVSGSIHYPRSTPEMWPDLIKKSKDGGLDIIETYVFWDMHEPVRGQFDFTGRKDLVKFVKLVGAAGLYLHLRIGPYVCAEWNYGGFPIWLHFLPNIELRTDNEPYKAEMGRFVAYIVNLMKQNNLYASQGGPIILSQIENEYGNVDWEYGDRAKTYIDWCAQTAVSMNTGVPWVMCQQSDAPDPMINTCNGFYCDQFTPNSPQKPKFWTENWSGWFNAWGNPVPYRPTEDVAFAVARFYQYNGSLMNYYMYQGGTNFERTSGGPFITTSYDYDALIDEYGLLRQPKWGHLKDLHKAIKVCEDAMVASFGTTTSLGQNLEATVFQTGSGQCAAFLANFDNGVDATVNFNGNNYDLPAWSVSILPDCQNVAFNTAKINAVAATSNFVRHLSQNSSNSSSGATFSGWSWYKEPVGISSSNAVVLTGLVEQINTTADKTDYLWYSTNLNLNNYDPILRDDSQILLHVDSLGHVLYAYVNGNLIGSGKGSASNNKVSIEVPVNFEPGNNSIDLLSVTVGLQNYGAFFDESGAGLTGVQLKALINGSTPDLSADQWEYQVGLKGEQLGLSHGGSTLWVSQPTLLKNTSLTWYKTTFAAPPGTSPVAIDFTGMGKGQAWINGQSIGRYWPANIADPNANCADCNYRGTYDQNKCLRNCGQPSQQFYHVPRSWLKPSENILVLLEEVAGDPTLISVLTREIGNLCVKVSETYPVPMVLWSNNYLTRVTKPTLILECPSPTEVISELLFVSFGNPHGACGSFSHGRCRSKRARRVVHKACMGKTRCSIEVSTENLGDPCADVTKTLVVEASCS